MAKTHLIKDGFGQLELNQVAFRRDGRIEAQCALNATDFPGGTGKYAENGMILVIDKVNKEVRLPDNKTEAGHTTEVEDGVLYALNYSTEHMYDERARGLKNFKLGPDDFYPRLGFLSVGDRFTTNACIYESGTFANEAALKSAIATGTLLGIPSTDGYISLVSDSNASPVVLQAVEFTTMPDGQPAIKFVVIKA